MEQHPIDGNELDPTSTGGHDGPAADVFLDIEAEPDRVWRALTTEGGLAPWMGDGATVDPRVEQAPLRTRRQEAPFAVAHALDARFHFRVRLLGPTRDVIEREALSCERRWCRRQRLRGRRRFSLHGFAEDGLFPHREERLPGFAMEDEGMSALGDLRDGGETHAIAFDLDEVGGRRQVAIPDIVADELVVPAPLSGTRIERNQRVPKEVVAGAVATEEVEGR